MTLVARCPIVKPRDPSTGRHLLKVFLAVVVADLLDRVKAAECKCLVLVDRWADIFAVIAVFHLLKCQRISDLITLLFLSLFLSLPYLQLSHTGNVGQTGLNIRQIRYFNWRCKGIESLPQQPPPRQIVSVRSQIRLVLTAHVHRYYMCRSQGTHHICWGGSRHID